MSGSAHEREAGVAHLGDDLLGRAACGRAAGPAGSLPGFQSTTAMRPPGRSARREQRQIRACGDRVVVRVGDENEVDARAAAGAGCRGEANSGTTLASCSRSARSRRCAIRRRLDLDREHGCRADPTACGEIAREVAGAGAEVGDRRPGGSLQRRDQLRRLLPGVALRIVEDLRPVLDVVEPKCVAVARSSSVGMRRLPPAAHRRGVRRAALEAPLPRRRVAGAAAGVHPTASRSRSHSAEISRQVPQRATSSARSPRAARRRCRPPHRRRRRAPRSGAHASIASARRRCARRAWRRRHRPAGTTTSSSGSPGRAPRAPRAGGGREFDTMPVRRPRARRPLQRRAWRARRRRQAVGAGVVMRQSRAKSALEVTRRAPAASNTDSHHARATSRARRRARRRRSSRGNTIGGIATAARAPNACCSALPDRRRIPATPRIGLADRLAQMDQRAHRVEQRPRGSCGGAHARAVQPVLCRMRHSQQIDAVLAEERLALEDHRRHAPVAGRFERRAGSRAMIAS